MESNGASLRERATDEEQSAAIVYSQLVEVLELSENIVQKTIKESMDELQTQSDESIHVDESVLKSDMKSNGMLPQEANETKDSSVKAVKNGITEDLEIESNKLPAKEGDAAETNIDSTAKTEDSTEFVNFEVDDAGVSSSLSSSSSSSDEFDEKPTKKITENKDVTKTKDAESEITPATADSKDKLLAHIKDQLELEEKEVPKEAENQEEMATTRGGEEDKGQSSHSVKETKVLETKLADSETRNEELQTDMEELQNINKKLKEDLTSKSNELEATSIVLHERDETISSLREELADSQKSKEALTSELGDTRTEVAEVKETLETKENSLKELKDNVERFQSKNDEQEQVISKLKDDLEMANAELGRAGQEKSLTESQLEDELEKAKSEIRSGNQSVSKLEAKLSNSQTLTDKADVESQKLKEEIKSLKDKIRWLEKKRSSEKTSASSSPRSQTQSPTRSETQVQAEQMDKRLSLESQRRSQERIQELQQKVIQVNAENHKIKTDYDEAVKALEAVDKVYSVREMALQKYKAELEEANELLKRDASEIEHLKQEISQLKGELRKAEENKAERDELREQIARSKESAIMYKDELDHVRKDLSDQVHELNLAQARARERGKKIQIMDLEIREVKDTLLISKNVLEEKEKNMASIRASFDAEKERAKQLEREIDELLFVKKKLGFTEEEKTRVEGKLKQKEHELRETHDKLNNIINKKKEQEYEIQALDKEHKKSKKRCEDREHEIVMLKQIIEGKESDIEEQLMELIHLRGQIDDLNHQLTDIWASYSADKAYWRNKTERNFTSRRRPKSAPPKRIHKTSPPEPKTHPGTHSMTHRRLVNKLGVSLINPNYIQTQHRNVPKASPATDNGNHTDGSPRPEQPNNESSLAPLLIDSNRDSPPRLSPRPPDTEKSPDRKQRPGSSYGTRTYPPSAGYHGEMEMEDVWMEGGSLASGDSEEQLAKHVVHKGDRVMIQSEIVGDGTVNVSGIVKYVGKVGTKSAGSSVYVGLKLDQPFGDNSGTVSGRRYFKCQPKHGKLVKVSDIHAIMHPRTHNYERVKPITLD